MEYVPGEDLKNTIRRIGPLTVRKVLAIGKQICQGLSETHGLGVILYEMSTGRTPFGGDSTYGVAVKQPRDAPKDPATINPEIPAALSRLILKCLAKDPARTRRHEALLEAALGRKEAALELMKNEDSKTNQPALSVFSLLGLKDRAIQGIELGTVRTAS
jgi:serine/threonine protein kinase